MEIKVMKRNSISFNHIRLNNGVEMPMIGMGTFSINVLKLALIVRKAVKMGYCSYDSASAYGNERWIGRGIKYCGKSRANLFITTKLNNDGQRIGDGCFCDCSLSVKHDVGPGFHPLFSGVMPQYIK